MAPILALAFSLGNANYYTSVLTAWRSFLDQGLDTAANQELLVVQAFRSPTIQVD